MVQISKLYHLPHMSMQGYENSRQKAKIWFLLISGGHNVTSTHDKASLITYLCPPGRLLLLDPQAAAVSRRAEKIYASRKTARIFTASRKTAEVVFHG